MVTLEHLSKMAPGIECFNQQHYWECHEELEHIWLEDRTDPVRNIYWAIIQVAASMIHFREKNLIGAQGMINKSKEKFKKCRDLNVINSLALDQLSWNEFEKLSLKVPEKTAVLEDFKELFDFRFKNFKGKA
jgi:predicted metal-dependent hydrolase